MKEFYEILAVILIIVTGVTLFFLFDGSPDVYEVLRNQVLNQQCK